MQTECKECPDAVTPEIQIEILKEQLRLASLRQLNSDKRLSRSECLERFARDEIDTLVSDRTTITTKTKKVKTELLSLQSQLKVAQKELCILQAASAKSRANRMSDLDELCRIYESELSHSKSKTDIILKRDIIDDKDATIKKLKDNISRVRVDEKRKYTQKLEEIEARHLRELQKVKTELRQSNLVLNSMISKVATERMDIILASHMSVSDLK